MDAHEAAQMHQNFSQQLLQDHIAACSLPEHNLISVGHPGPAQRLTPRLPLTPAMTVFLSVSSGPRGPLLSRSKPRTGPPPAWPACYETAAVCDGNHPASRAAVPPLPLRKESIILSSRLLHDRLPLCFCCYTRDPWNFVFRAPWGRRAELNSIIRIVRRRTR